MVSQIARIASQARGKRGIRKRERDGCHHPAFGMVEQLGSADLALTLWRAHAAEREQFFIRMYDGSTPPLYSRVSAAIFTNVPVG